MEAEKTRTIIQIEAKTNLDALKERLKAIEAKLDEASSMIDELASEGISVELYQVLSQWDCRSLGIGLCLSAQK